MLGQNFRIQKKKRAKIESRQDRVSTTDSVTSSEQLKQQIPKLDDELYYDENSHLINQSNLIQKRVTNAESNKNKRKRKRIASVLPETELSIESRTIINSIRANLVNDMSVCEPKTNHQAINSKLDQLEVYHELNLSETDENKHTQKFEIKQSKNGGSKSGLDSKSTKHSLSETALRKINKIRDSKKLELASKEKEIMVFKKTEAKSAFSAKLRFGDLASSIRPRLVLPCKLKVLLKKFTEIDSKLNYLKMKREPLNFNLIVRACKM